jgi:hypothetical protein
MTGKHVLKKEIAADGVLGLGHAAKSAVKIALALELAAGSLLLSIETEDGGQRCEFHAVGRAAVLSPAQKARLRSGKPVPELGSVLHVEGTDGFDFVVPSYLYRTFGDVPAAHHREAAADNRTKALFAGLLKKEGVPLMSVTTPDSHVDPGQFVIQPVAYDDPNCAYDQSLDMEP